MTSCTATHINEHPPHNYRTCFPKLEKATALGPNTKSVEAPFETSRAGAQRSLPKPGPPPRPRILDLEHSSEKGGGAGGGGGGWPEGGGDPLIHQKRRLTGKLPTPGLHNRGSHDVPARRFRLNDCVLK